MFQVPEQEQEQEQEKAVRAREAGVEVLRVLRVLTVQSTFRA